MPKRALLLLFSAFIALPGVARASSITFLGAAPTAGSLSYAGGTTPLVGSNISLDLIVGTATPLHPGGAALCIGCVLDFVTGDFVVGDPTAWIFQDGGSFSIVGGVDLTGDGLIGAGDIANGTTLISGAFSGLQFVLTDGATPLFSGLQLSFLSTVLDTNLTGYYGLGPTAGSETIMFMTFAGQGIAPGAFDTAAIENIVVSAPEPVSMVLLGGGLVAAFARRRRAA
jgi:hypothetical protein